MCNGNKNCKGCTANCKKKSTMSYHYSLPCAIGSGGVAYGLGVSPMYSAIVGAAGGFVIPKFSMSVPAYDALVGAGALGIATRVAGVSQNMKYIGMGAGAVGGYMYGDKSGSSSTGGGTWVY